MRKLGNLEKNYPKMKQLLCNIVHKAPGNQSYESNNTTH